MDLLSFFDRAIRASLHDLGFREDPTGSYLAELLTRFARTENLYPRGVAVPRLESVVDMLLEVQAAWLPDTLGFRPEHEVSVRRHIGDYTLFMTGIFPERVKRSASTDYYIAQGSSAYRFVSEHARASSRGGPGPWRRLADRFEGYAGVLDYTRRVHFYDAPGHPFFRLRFE